MSQLFAHSAPTLKTKPNAGLIKSFGYFTLEIGASSETQTKGHGQCKLNIGVYTVVNCPGNYLFHGNAKRIVGFSISRRGGEFFVKIRFNFLI